MAEKRMDEFFNILLRVEFKHATQGTSVGRPILSPRAGRRG